MKHVISVVCFTLLTFAVLAQEQQNKSNDKIEIPSLDLKTMEGGSKNLQSYAKNDKFTILAFWATWCKPCKKELSNLKYLLPDWKKRFDVEVVAISLDDSRTTRKVESFVNGERWKFDVLLDVNKKTKRELNFAAIPYSMLIDKQGRIAYKHSGYKEGDEYKLEDKIKALKNKGKK